MNRTAARIVTTKPTPISNPPITCAVQKKKCEKHTNRRPNNLTPTRVLVRSTLEADREDGDKRNGHSVLRFSYFITSSWYGRKELVIEVGRMRMKWRWCQWKGCCNYGVWRELGLHQWYSGCMSTNTTLGTECWGAEDLVIIFDHSVFFRVQIIKTMVVMYVLDAVVNKC